MGRHRAELLKTRRGVALWPIVAVAVVAVLGLGWFAWDYVNSVLDERAASSSEGCPEGNATLRVAVAPSIAEPVQQAATAWAAQRPVIRNHCVQVEVQAMDSAMTLQNLSQGWDQSKVGPPPSAWLPESSLWVNQLKAANAALLGSTPASIATSPVLLAVPEPAGAAMLSGSSFRWSDLPELASVDNGWSRFQKPEWGALTLTIPDPARNPASALAIQSALAGASPQGRGPVTTEMLSDDRIKDVMNRLATANTAKPPSTTLEALVELGKVDDLAKAPFEAVPVVEADLYRRNVGKDAAPSPVRTLSGVQVGGPTPTADYPFVALAGELTDDVQVRAAQRFSDFLKEPDQQRLLAQQSGVRVGSTQERPNPSPGIRWAATPEALAPADADATQQISAAWASSGAGAQAVTVLVDVSRSMTQDGGDGQTRMAWLKRALRGQVERSVGGLFGLWEFSRSLDGAKPYKQLAPTKPVSQQRTLLMDAINGLKPTSATQTYTSVLAVYRSAMENYEAGRTNRIVVVTDGSNDGGITLQQLQTELNKLRNDEKPLSISFIAFGSDVDRAPLNQIARANGGTVSVAANGRALDPALSQLLAGNR
ncbi:substrate-binding domain-containing protein [Allokutzneria albata]|uniref:von Willebrand factor type A domain-containing protein n=1 Tax=Allokutzneria albata TaxID=211114 RepID=A0A1G9VDV9_ALLAB|nr:substrate-binding domain-containing protein [Allokutzneria albata]SDM70227.1 von Willebrand factor type A domain-containing protein [Allokutzneria albata]